MSTVHAIFMTFMSVYLVFFSELFSDDSTKELLTFRNSNLSTFTLGVSAGFFTSDLAMIIWLYPSLAGLEYVLHHVLSLCTLSYAILTGEGQLYTYMVMISETTTPCINVRWYLDTAGMKRSNAYLVNGVIMFLAWLVARIISVFYLFYHVYLHYDQVMQMHMIGYLLLFVVPSALAIMNLRYFWKIFKGLKKTLAKRH